MENKLSVGQLFKDLRIKAGYKTQKELSVASGVSQTTLSRIEADIQKPLPNTLMALSKYLRVSYAELMINAGYFNGMSEEKKELVADFFDDHSRLTNAIENAIITISKRGKYSDEFSREVIDLIEVESRNFRQKHEVSFAYTPGGIRKILNELDLDIDSKIDFLAMLNRVKDKQASLLEHRDNDDTTIPVLGKVRPDVPLLDEANWEEQTQHPEGIKADFAARAAGYNMLYAGILDGDMILFRECLEPYNGEVVAIRYLNEITNINLRYFIKKDGQVLLRSANPEYEDIELNGDYQIIGVMVGLIRESPPSLFDYEFMLTAKSEVNDRWTKTIMSATELGVTPEAIQNMIEMHVTMALNLTKKK
ncbi:helix-turn-helix domain-containing protein [Anaeroselena agilis]|uniref:S24 family peptidase n=1 Tax=Anaeroselena agilis TaxID=3063788 RepID=A0ABU3NT89_9FIRM|nr:S24 family peptidase [Selenomonadales bacterium 4137-cl]